MATVSFHDLTESEVIRASEQLEQAGFSYDEDYTTLYGSRWEIVGIRCMGPRAIEVSAVVANA